MVLPDGVLAGFGALVILVVAIALLATRHHQRFTVRVTFDVEREDDKPPEEETEQ